MTTIRQDIEKDYKLKKFRRPLRVMHAEGPRFSEEATGNEVVYCPVCKGPVVDSKRAREHHALQMPGCRKAITQ